jgi:hypothetical protein
VSRRWGVVVDDFRPLQRLLVTAPLMPDILARADQIVSRAIGPLRGCREQSPSSISGDDSIWESPAGMGCISGSRDAGASRPAGGGIQSEFSRVC